MSTITKNTRRARVLAAVLAAFVFGSCDGDGVSGPPQSTALAFTITAAAGVTADQGRVQIEGTARRTVTLQPGETREIEVPAGTYQVALEGLTGGVVTSYFQRSNVSVTEGRLTSITATLSTFAGVSPTVPSSGVLGQPVTVSWAPVSGADSYDVEASSSDLFSPLLESQTVGGTSTQFTFSQAGVVFFRVRPRTRFNSAGPFSAASTGVTVADPAVAEVTVEPVSVTVPLNGTADFVATARSASGTIIPGAQFTWSSDDESVATVDGNGRATGVGGGVANIIALGGLPAGTVSALVLVFYGVGRTYTESFRERPRQIGGLFTWGHVAAWASAAAGWTMLFLVVPGETGGQSVNWWDADLGQVMATWPGVVAGAVFVALACGVRGPSLRSWRG